LLQITILIVIYTRRHYGPLKDHNNEVRKLSAAYVNIYTLSDLL